MIMLSCTNRQVFIIYFLLIQFSNCYQQLRKRFKPLGISVNKYLVPLYCFSIIIFFIMRNNYVQDSFDFVSFYSFVFHSYC